MAESREAEELAMIYLQADELDEAVIEQFPDPKQRKAFVNKRIQEQVEEVRRKFHL